MKKAKTETERWRERERERKEESFFDLWNKMVSPLRDFLNYVVITIVWVVIL